MSISVSALSDNHVLLETSNGISVLYDHDEPVAVRINGCTLSANSCVPALVGNEKVIVIPQSEIEYIVRTI